jgi:hypothetical protein
MAMTHEIKGRKVKVLPLLFEKCEIPDFLKDKLYADFTNPDNFDAPFLRLLRSIGISKPIRKEITAQTAVVTAPLPPLPATTPAPVRALVKFEDITIIGVDKNRLYRPDPKKELYNVYFELSAVPPSEWVQIFDGERRFPRHTMWRRAWIEGKHVVVHCCLDEIKSYHLRDLKEDVATSNKKYREYLHRLALEEMKEQKRVEEERKSIDDALKGLDFK